MRCVRVFTLCLISLTLCLSAPAFAETTANYSGDWSSTFGPMKLTQVKSKVRGYYVWDGEKGIIEGTVKGRKLVFQYKALEETGEGVFTLAKDGRSFSGKWRVTGTKEWGEWNGKRAEKKYRSFSGVWKTKFGRLRLIQTEQSVLGISAYSKDSKLWGEVKGRVLQFQYTEENGQTGKGRFELAEDGLSFTGRWRGKGSSEWSDWRGQRVIPKRGQRWLVVLEANWETNLAEKEYSFGKMLESFFARKANVGVRHRSFSSIKSLQKWCRDIAFLAEPTILVIATHGTPKGLVAGEETVQAKDLAPYLQHASNLKLLHFAACSIMKGPMAKNLMKSLKNKNAFPISGYTRDVDWGASAVLEFMYYELILTHQLTPKSAARRLLKILPFAGKENMKEAPFESTDFRFLDPDSAAEEKK